MATEPQATSGAAMFDGNSFEDQSFDARSWLMDAAEQFIEFVVTIARRLNRR